MNDGGVSMWKDFIDVNPQVCHGQPCFKGTRIMAYIVLEMLEAGENVQEILNSYPQLTQNHIKAVLHYAAEVIKTGEFIPFAEIS